MSIKIKVALAQDSLAIMAKIPSGVQSKILKWALAFQADPTATGINYEKIRQARDKNLRSVRIDQDWRGIVFKPDKGDVYGSIEGVIHLFEMYMHNRGFDTPVAEGYGAIESPNGELGYYIVADGSKYPFRARTRPPCFINYQMFPKMIEGHQLADIVAVLGSLNIIAAELDR